MSTLDIWAQAVRGIRVDIGLTLLAKYELKTSQTLLIGLTSSPIYDNDVYKHLLNRVLVSFEFYNVAFSCWFSSAEMDPLNQR